MDGGAWWATVHGVAKSRTWLSDFIFTSHFHALEKEMATHSSVLAWRIPGTGEPGGLLSMGSHRVGHDWSDLAAAARLGCHWSSMLSPGHTVWWFIRAPPCKSRKLWCSDNWRIIATWIPKSLWNSFSSTGAKCAKCAKSTFILGPEMSTGRKPSSVSDTG